MIQMNLSVKQKHNHRHGDGRVIAKVGGRGRDGVEFGINRRKLAPLEWLKGGVFDIPG